ncbi:uncharacterized protein F5891DRAFT_219011 [Suillus fuscotomentosus]|uniref:DUF6534 domain-containing protein n=1 Tax=Suillus fuscotomentosus TaxID=1912939 RepID=A0AAD4EKJ5_9AGAM|nr:uncharacterized protein F5891DRAFT_219011 [Suillus fuscotomentosus]KAG1907897.1 hypothetical protein F5891DRAFT_219011 [Suillus fuscotomentosus]
MNMNQVVLTYSSAIRIVASVMTGFGISSIVFLILTAQVWIYFRRDTIRSVENRLSKALVAFIWLIQAVQMAVATWISFAHAFKFNMTLCHMLINLALYNGICSFITSVVHGVFISRVFRLEKSFYGKRRMTFVLIAFCVMEQVLSTIYISRISHYNLNVVVNWSTLISLGCSAIDDVLIAGTTAYILYNHRTESPRTNRMITKLIIFCSQTGLITTVVASITMGIWAACRFDVYHLHMCFPIGGLYATCLLANLIARDSYLQPQTAHEAEISEISFARSTQAIHVGLPDNKSGPQEISVMQEGTDSSKASSC